MQLSQLCWDVVLFLSAAYSLYRGGRSEKIAAVAFCLTFLANTLSYQSAWHHMHVLPILLDMLLVSLLLWIALRSDRWWPLAAVAFQLVAALARLAPVLDLGTRSLAAYVGVIGWDYMTLAALVAGTALEARHTKTHLAHAPG